MIKVNITMYSVSFYLFSKTNIIGIGSMKISVFFRYRYRYLLSVKARYIGIGQQKISVSVLVVSVKLK